MSLLLSSGWWIPCAVVATFTGLLVKAAYFHPWLSLGVLLDLGILAAITVQWPASLY